LPVIFVHLALIRQNFHESLCRKSLTIEWHKNLFNKSKDEGVSELQAGMNSPFDEAITPWHGT